MGVVLILMMSMLVDAWSPVNTYTTNNAIYDSIPIVYNDYLYFGGGDKNVFQLNH